MAVARVGIEMKAEPDPNQLYFSAIALGPVFLIPTVRERRSKMFEIGENSVIERYAEKSQPSKALNITFWVLQVSLAAAFLISGGTKVAGAQMHVATFERHRVGAMVQIRHGLCRNGICLSGFDPENGGVGSSAACGNDDMRSHYTPAADWWKSAARSSTPSHCRASGLVPWSI